MIHQLRPKPVNETLNHGSEEHLDPQNIDQDLMPSQETPPPKRKLGLIVIGILLIGGLSFLGFQALGGNRATDKTKNKKEAVTPVNVAKATVKTVPIQLEAIGTVQTGVSVAVTPQVSGKIIGVHFQKGQDVHKGQLLFTLDSHEQWYAIQQAQGTLAKDRALVQQAQATLEKDRGLIQQARATLEKDQSAVLQAQATLERDRGLVKQAQANLAKDEAQSKFAKSQADRYADLLQQGAVNQDQAQQYSTNYQASLATLEADRAAIANAEAVVKGDLAAIANAEAVVKSDRIAITNAEAVVQGDLAAIANTKAVLEADTAAFNNLQVQLSYTQVYAPVDGRAGNILVNVGNVMQANGSTPLVNIVQVHPIQVAFSLPEANLTDIQKYAENGKLKVDIAFANGAADPIAGVLSFVNNTVDNTTGTIQLIGDFENADGKLWPGQSVSATLTLRQQHNATVIPSQAVQNGPDGQFVFEVKSDQTVENVPVTVSLTIAGLAVIQKGVQPGDTVVIDGQANLVAGGKVKIKKQGNQSSGNTTGKASDANGGDSATQSHSAAKGDRTPSPDHTPASPASTSDPSTPTDNSTASPSPQAKRHHRSKKQPTSDGSGAGSGGGSQ